MQKQSIGDLAGKVNCTGTNDRNMHFLEIANSGQSKCSRALVRLLRAAKIIIKGSLSEGADDGKTGVLFWDFAARKPGNFFRNENSRERAEPP